MQNPELENYTLTPDEMRKFANALSNQNQLKAKPVKKRRKVQFSKKLVVVAWMILAVVIAMDFVLLWNHRVPMKDELIALIGMISGGTNIGYLIQNTIRDTSLNKNKLKLTDGEVVPIDKPTI